MRILHTTVALLRYFTQMMSAEQTPQTSAQIQTQKELAGQAIISGVVEDGKSPLKLFEAYFDGIKKFDASFLQFLTPHAVKKWFDDDALTAESKRRIQEGLLERDERDHTLVKFRYTSDPERPKIVFGYQCNYRGDNGQRIRTAERAQLTLIKTAQGWRIDLMESDPD